MTKTLWLGCALAAGLASTYVLAATPDPNKVHIFYLHGRIIEDGGGLRPAHPSWGVYDYPAVLEALRSRGALVISEPRPKDTDIGKYAQKVLAQVNELVAAGVPESNIAVVGFSKGASIAITVSGLPANEHAGMKFVFLGACAEMISDDPTLRLKGHVLSIREKSDELTIPCKPVAELGPALASISELTIDIGNGHGAFFMPNSAWVDATLNWIHGR